MASTIAGFRFGAHAGGIKASGAPDVAIMASDRPAAAAAVFTRNRVVAAPVELSRRALARSGGFAQAVVVNSGNANACTGRRGMIDARAMAASAAAALGVKRDLVLVASTGVIGVPLPMDKVTPAIERAAAAARPARFADFSSAILTTDRGPKTAKRSLRAGGVAVSLAGCTKGAGMIAPNMATTLTFVATDARVSPRELDRCLREAADATFNSICVDGDTSTNDMILVMANGAAGGRAASRKEIASFGEALHDLLDELARKLMRDGEGVHHVVEVVVQRARTREQARQIARTIASSPLVKTAFAGGDANWGRILAAAGRAGVDLRQERLALSIGGVPIVAGGVRSGGPSAERRAEAAMQRPSYSVVLDIGEGKATASTLACDLSHDYVTINADYRT